MSDSVVLGLSDEELRVRLVQRDWPVDDAAALVDCARNGCPECSLTLIETLG